MKLQPHPPSQRPPPYTQAELDLAKCVNPMCPSQHPHELWIRPKCHPESPTVCCYIHDEAVLEVYCAVCKRGVVRIAIAPAPQAETMVTM